MKKVALRNIKRAYNKKWKYVLCMLPVIFLFALFVYYPRLSVIPLSFYKWGPYSFTKEYIGLFNYKMLFEVRLNETLGYICNTLLYVTGLFLIQTLLAFILALALRKNTHRNKFFRTYFFFPMVLSSTLVSLTWAYMYDPNLGVINSLLGALGVKGYPGVNFFVTNAKAILLIVLVHIWAKIGYPMMVLHSGLSTVSGDLEEAAKIEGANRWQIFWRITIPLMLPTLLRLSLMTITTGVMASDYVVMIGSRSSIKDFDTLSAYIFKKTLMSSSYGEVSAISVCLLIVLSAVSLLQFVALKKVENSILGE